MIFINAISFFVYLKTNCYFMLKLFYSILRMSVFSIKRKQQPFGLNIFYFITH